MSHVHAHFIVPQRSYSWLSLDWERGDDTYRYTKPDKTKRPEGLDTVRLIGLTEFLDIPEGMGQPARGCLHDSTSKWALPVVTFIPRSEKMLVVNEKQYEFRK